MIKVGPLMMPTRAVGVTNQFPRKSLNQITAPKLVEDMGCAWEKLQVANKICTPLLPCFLAYSSGDLPGELSRRQAEKRNHFLKWLVDQPGCQVLQRLGFFETYF